MFNTQTDEYLLIQQHYFHNSIIRPQSKVHKIPVLSSILGNFYAGFYEDTEKQSKDLVVSYRPQQMAYQLVYSVQKNISRYIVLSILMQEGNHKLGYRLFHTPGYTIWSYIIFRRLSINSRKCSWCKNFEQIKFWNVYRQEKEKLTSHLFINLSKAASSPITTDVLSKNLLDIWYHTDYYADIGDISNSFLHSKPSANMPGQLRLVGKHCNASMECKVGYLIYQYITTPNVEDRDPWMTRSSELKIDAINTPLYIKQLPAYISPSSLRQPYTMINFLTMIDEETENCTLMKCTLKWEIKLIPFTSEDTSINFKTQCDESQFKITYRFTGNTSP